MSKAIKRIIELSNEYFSKFPAPEAFKLLGSSFLLGYTYSDPNTNSKKKVDVLFNPDKPTAGTFFNSLPSLTYQEKPNRLQIGGTYGSFLVGQKHQNILQDQIFGVARRSQNKKKWVYVAKVKEQKVKSVFDGGKGAAEHIFDAGERYTGTNIIGLFILDAQKRTITRVNTKQGQFVCSPDFADAQGNKVVYYGFKKQHFGYGLAHCFNRQCKIYEAVAKQQTFQITQLESKFKSNMYPRVSSCGSYMLYFAGEGKTHIFYMNLVILKRNTQSQKWEKYHQFPDFATGSYNQLRSEFFTVQGKLFALVQSVQKASIKLYTVDIEAKTITPYTQNISGQSEALMAFDQNTNLLVTKTTNIRENTFSYAYLPNKLTKIPALNTQNDFKVETLEGPIPHFVIRSNVKKNLLDEPLQKSPLVVLIHGGPHGYVDTTLTFFKWIMLKAGYTIIAPNFSGSSSWGQKYIEKALGKIGQLDAEEIVACVQQLLKRDSSIDAGRVYLYGGSYGGYMTGILGSRYSEHFKAGALLNPVLSIPFMFGTTDIPEWCAVEALGRDSIEDLTPEDYAQMYKMSPISTPLKIPGLIVLGQKDRRVPYQSGKIYASLSRAKGVKTEVYIYPESDHRLADSVETSVDVIVKTLSFFEDNK